MIEMCSKQITHSKYIYKRKEINPCLVYKLQQQCTQMWFCSSFR